MLKTLAGDVNRSTCVANRDERGSGSLTCGKKLALERCTCYYFLLEGRSRPDVRFRRSGFPQGFSTYAQLRKPIPETTCIPG